VRLWGREAYAATGVEVKTVKAAAGPPFGWTQGQPHSKVDCPGWAGILRCDLAVAPEIAGGRDE